MATGALSVLWSPPRGLGLGGACSHWGQARASDSALLHPVLLLLQGLVTAGGGEGDDEAPAHTDIANAAFEWTPLLGLPHCCFASAQCVTGESQCFIIKSGSCGIILPDSRPFPGRAGLSCNAWWVRHVDCMFGLGYFGFMMGSLKTSPPQ